MAATRVLDDRMVSTGDRAIITAGLVEIRATLAVSQSYTLMNVLCLLPRI